LLLLLIVAAGILVLLDGEYNLPADSGVQGGNKGGGAVTNGDSGLA
jgi:hypothetical protein